MTIPKACRDQLGLRTGTVLDCEARDGVLVARKVQPEDVFRKWRGRGRLPTGPGVDEYLDQARG
ncbi:MAG: AbrB/MazE/SpoVT family DNA-binding domain-containing protein [Gemmatimonadaceae bacterium]|nr:AbrB/MazE/SpoVT family DNA-binding domain-containing protein [Gemmatimonadaceae bacterium]